MKTLLKYIKKYASYVFCIIGLLFFQAYLDLALPEYTSRIVNIGIQQGGIEKAIPEVIRVSTFEDLQLFLSEEEIQTFSDSYQLFTKEEMNEKEYQKMVKKYPSLETEGLYVLKEKHAKQVEDLFLNPFFFVSTVKTETEQMKTLKTTILSLLPSDIGVDENVPLLTILHLLPKEQMDLFKSQFTKQIEEMPSSIVEQTAILSIQNEYKEIGRNMEQIQTHYIFISGLKMLGIALLSMVATILVGFLGAKTAAMLGRDLRREVFEKVVSFSSVEFKEYSTASLITRSTNDIQQVQMLIVMLLRTVFYAPIIGIGGVLKVLHTNTNMAWVVAIALGLILLLVITLFAIVMPKFRIMQKLIDKLNLVTREILTGLPVIRAFATARHEENRFDKANLALMKNNLFVNHIMAFMMPAMMFIMNSIALLIIWKGAKAIDMGTLQVGDMMALIQYTMQIIMAFLMISMVSIILPRASVSMRRIDEVLLTKVKITDPVVPSKIDEKNKGMVEFKNVSFRYPDAVDDVISNISFVAKPGEVTAFIGSTGSGKSTLINLIPRFFDVTGGAILVDGVNIKELTLHDLRSRIGYVPQKGILFSGTIASNIAYGVPSLKKETLQKSLDIAQATEFVQTLPDKENYVISQGGTNVSGGQKQRLSIARAIAIHPEIYIFDDSFSALDFKTDAKLRNALAKETKGSTVLIVAQRISTILNANQIIVLNEGKIVGKGTHQELLKNCAVYREIAESQLSKEELENA